MVSARQMDESLCCAGSCEAFSDFEGSKTRGSWKEAKLPCPWVASSRQASSRYTKNGNIDSLSEWQSLALASLRVRACLCSVDDGGSSGDRGQGEGQAGKMWRESRSERAHSTGARWQLNPWRRFRLPRRIARSRPANGSPTIFFSPPTWLFITFLPEFSNVNYTGRALHLMPM